VPFDKSAAPLALEIGSKLRQKGVATEIYLEEAKFKNKLSYVNKLGVKYAVIIGEEEIIGKFFILKDMISGDQARLSEKELLKNLFE